MKRIIYIVFLAYGCQNLSTEIRDYNQRIEFKSITLIDTFSNELFLDNAVSITEAEFHPIFMGAIKDSILLNYWSNKIKNKSYDWDNYKRPDSFELTIYVDTSQFVGSAFTFWALPPPPKNYEWKDNDSILKRSIKRGPIKSYPVFIKNISRDTLNVGYGEYIPMVIEAKDSLENWQPIQAPYFYYCGTGLSNYYLPPNEIVVTSCKLFEGEFTTKMRLSFGFDTILKSNEFVGKMNYKQFRESNKRLY